MSTHATIIAPPPIGLTHPDLIAAAPTNYRKLRDPDPDTGRPRYGFDHIIRMIGRTPTTWHAWGRMVQPSSGRLMQMPHYISAYMALLDGAHPRYEAFVRPEIAERVWSDETFWPTRPKSFRTLPVPPIPTVDDKSARKFLEDRRITERDIREAFGWSNSNNEDAGAIDRTNSPRTIGRDGVKWAMLTLMVDEHPVLAVKRRVGVTWRKEIRE